VDTILYIAIGVKRRSPIKTLFEIDSENPRALKVVNWEAARFETAKYRVF
jgi:hypothetical protein